MNQFKKTGLIIIGLFLTLDLIGQQKVSETGFYEGDSVFFEIKDSLIDYTSIEISVNTFSNEFKPYNGGFWLYNRNYTPNTWEDQQFSKYSKSAKSFYDKENNTIDTLAQRGELKKVNFIRTRFLDDLGETINEKVYFIGVNGKGVELMHQLPIIHLFVDSLDAFGSKGFYGPGEGAILPPGISYPQDIIGFEYTNNEFEWNYNLGWGDDRVKKTFDRSRVEKECFIEIIDLKNQILAKNQKVGIRISGNGSVHFMNKAMQVIARNIYGNTRITTSIFGEEKEYKKLKFRTAGKGSFNFGYHELGNSLLQGLELGEIDFQPAILYLNGSFWSFVYIQEKTDEYLASKYSGVDPNEINLFDPSYIFGTFNSNKAIDTLNVIDTTYGFIPLNAESPLRIENWNFEIPEEYQSAINKMFTPEHDHLLLYKIKEGNANSFLSTSEILTNKSFGNETDKDFKTIDSLIDFKQWLKYVCFVDFIGDYDQLNNNILIVEDGIHKPRLLAKDFDGFLAINADQNFWNEMYFEDEQSLNLTNLIIKDYLLINTQSINWLLRIYQDLLNTNFLYKNSSSVLKKVYPTGFFLQIENHFNSWNGSPNGGPYNKNDYINIKNNIDTFLKERPKYTWQILADQWMPEEKFNLNSRNKIKINLEEVPRDCIIVKLNSLEIDSSWQGEYYPKPSLLISVEKNNCIDINDYIWKEYPDSSLTMELFLTKTTTLTLVKR